MLQKGSVVLYKNQCALITECGEKYTIVFAKTSQSVREKDVALLHRGPASSLAQAMCECVAVDYVCNQLNETWELLQDDEESCFGFSYLAELTLGDFPVEKAWSFYSALSTHPRFVMLPLTHSKEPCFSLRSQEEYEAITAKQTEKEKESELREAFIKRLKQKKLNLPEDGIFMSEVESFALGRTLSSKIMKEAGFSCTEQKAHALLLDTGIWNMSRNPYPSRWGLSLQSAKEPVGTPIDEERMQVQHTAYAIDNSTTGDPDDAIAFDGEYLWVHVADPAGTVVPDSPTDLDARFRGSTLYLPEGTSRMLEESSLAEYALGLAESLDPPRMSRALSFRLKPDADGIEDVAVFKTSVHVKRLTYEQADEQKDSAELAPLYEIANKNIERRKASGAVFIELPEVHVHVTKTENDASVSIYPMEPTESSAVVRECMLLAGEAAARFAFKNNIPFPYVSQEKPDIPKDIPDALAGQYRLRRCMKKRSVGVTPAHHAGIGIAMYSQVTSPLRRYSDLVAHQQLRAFLDSKPLLTKDEILERISAADVSAVASSKAERQSVMHWTLVYLAKNPDWSATAVIVDIKDRLATILIPSIAQESVIMTPPQAQLNDSLEVYAVDINIPELTVRYEVKT